MPFTFKKHSGSSLLLVVVGLVLAVALAASDGDAPGPWRCGGCYEFVMRFELTPHRWAKEVAAQSHAAELAKYEKDKLAYERCVVEHKPPSNADGTLVTGCAAPWPPGTATRSVFIVAPGDGSEYEVDICLEHGETRIRRVK